MEGKHYRIIATTYKRKGNEVRVEGACNDIRSAQNICNRMNADYRKKRDKDKSLPKTVWTYQVVE